MAVPRPHDTAQDHCWTSQQWHPAKGLEANAAKNLQNLESASGPASHFFSRHGAQTTLDQQLTRATKGLTPDGVQKAPMAASRFLTHRHQQNAVQAAQEIFGRTGTRAFTFDARYIVGEGFMRNSIEIIRTSNVRAIFDGSGNLISLFPFLGPI